MIPVPITTDIAAALAPLTDSIAHAWRTRQIFRTETEARISVLNDGWFPTPAAKYWQCVREQCVMLEQLAMASFEIRRNDIKIARLESMDRAPEQEVDLDEARFAREQMRSTVADRIREVRMWERLKAEQLAADPTIDTENVDAHQLISYTTQFAGRAARADVTGMSEGEQVNLAGQLLSAWKRCEQLGVLDQVKARLPAAQAEVVAGLLK